MFDRLRKIWLYTVKKYIFSSLGNILQSAKLYRSICKTWCNRKI